MLAVTGAPITLPTFMVTSFESTDSQGLDAASTLASILNDDGLCLNDCTFGMGLDFSYLGVVSVIFTLDQERKGH